MLISIITATYNSQQFLEQAIASLKGQHYQKKEYIIIDGLSVDQTVNIIQENSSTIQKYISEPDNGIYDALNKGIEIAKGDVIGILHSDDYYASPEVLTLVADKFKKQPELMAVYGDLEYVNRKGANKVIRYWQSGLFSRVKLKSGWMPPHPTLFIKKECFIKFGLYDISYQSAADYDLILRFLFKHSIKTDYIPEVLMKMRVGGLSNHSFKNRWSANKEDRKAMKNNGIPYSSLVAVLKPLRKLSQFWNKNV